MNKTTDVYIAKCFLNYEDDLKYKVYFNFEKKDKKYEIDEKNRRYIFFNDKNFFHVIPMDIKTYGSYAEQGFDHELNQEELTAVKNNMIQALKNYLSQELENKKQLYEAKMKALDERN